MEKQQTAVEYLAERMIRMIPTNNIVYESDVLMYIEQAKQMEKKQIIDAITFGQNNNSVSLGYDKFVAEEYFINNYKK